MSRPASSTKCRALTPLVILGCLSGVLASRVQDEVHLSVHEAGNHSENAIPSAPGVRELLSDAAELLEHVVKPAATSERPSRREGSAADSFVAVGSSHHQQADAKVEGSDKNSCERAKVKQELAAHRLVITKPKGGRAYVACEDNRKLIQKISCTKKECDGDPWCYVENSCGGWFNGCKKLPDVTLTCNKKPPEEEFRRRGRNGAVRGSAASLALLGALATLTATAAC